MSLKTAIMSFINAVLSQGAGVVSSGCFGQGGLLVGSGLVGKVLEEMHLAVLTQQLSLAGKPGFQTAPEIRISHAWDPASH